ncbi:helix-turn-helix domain-containing protein [Micromonospora chersina]|uniref:helix-turn-helix domain-containing protein n=1 Tax=Micromonospora chersina TaxID=47854 RepID=UPI00371A5AE4
MATIAEAQPQRMLKVEQAAARAQLGRTRMYELIKTGEIQSVKIGRSRRIPVEALDAYVARLVDEQCQAVA